MKLFTQNTHITNIKYNASRLCQMIEMNPQQTCKGMKITKCAKYTSRHVCITHRPKITLQCLAKYSLMAQTN